MEKNAEGGTRTRLERLAIVGAIRLPLLLPYRLRIAVVGWVFGTIVGPMAGYRDRVRANLAYACPDLPQAEVRRLARAVPANAGKMLAESASAREFTDRIADVPMAGDGLAALDEAHSAGRPIIAVSGHFGNFDAARAAMVHRGHTVGALYRPNDDPVLDVHYRGLLAGIAEPVFPRGRQGLGQMLRFLRRKNTVAILLDQFVGDGAPLTFFGRPAATTLSAAEMALKYDALLIPMFAARRGRSFEITVDAPIPHTDPRTMMQAYNDCLEKHVRADMDQWLWIHRRWKPARQRKRAAERTAPKPAS